MSFIRAIKEWHQELKYRRQRSLRIFILTGQKDFIHRVIFLNIKKHPSFILKNL